MPAILHYDSYGRALNKWRDTAALFRRTYDDHRDLTYVVSVTLNLLNKGLDLPPTDPDHPFNRYADIDKTGAENFHCLATDVMSEIQEQRIRQYVTSFFHSSGVNYPEMLELLGDYMLFADRAEDESYASDDDADTESETESDETAEEEDGTDDEEDDGSEDGDSTDDEEEDGSEDGDSTDDEEEDGDYLLGEDGEEGFDYDPNHF